MYLNSLILNYFSASYQRKKKPYVEEKVFFVKKMAADSSNRESLKDYYDSNALDFLWEYAEANVICFRNSCLEMSRQHTLNRTKHFGLFNSLFRKYSYGIVGRHCRRQEECHCVMIWDKVKECIRLAPRPIPILPIIGRGICHKSHDQCR